MTLIRDFARRLEVGSGGTGSLSFSQLRLGDEVLGEATYYSRFGFRAASEPGLCDEYDGGPAFRCVELIPGAILAGDGLVRYAPEFASLG